MRQVLSAKFVHFGTSDALHLLLPLISNAKFHKKRIFIYNSDLSSDYDFLSRAMVDDVMAKMNIPDAFISFIRHSEEGSKMVLAGHTDSSEGDGDISFPQTSGFSQGGKLSGIGFCLGMSMLLIRINSCKELTRFVPMASSVRRVTR